VSSEKTSEDPASAYWSLPVADLFQLLRSASDGLPSAEAAQRLASVGPNAIQQQRNFGALRMLAAQFASPLNLILSLAVLVSALAGEWLDALIVLFIVVGSGLLGFFQEFSANNAVERLRAKLTLKAIVLRDGKSANIPAVALVPGDVVLLSAGSLIAADGVVLEAKDFFVSQAVLTGETFPVEKRPGLAREDAGLSERTNCVFTGSNVRSGIARMLVTETGSRTEYGHIAARLDLSKPRTEFERGIHQFGMMLGQAMLALILVVFAANVFNAKPAVDSLLFAVALAVGLAPELLPAIVTVTLAKGAQDMARHGVIVRRLSAIENLGSMDVLCTDKTGTLSEGVIRLDSALDADGAPSEAVLTFAVLNAQLQSGLTNPLDTAIQAAAAAHPEYRKVDEIPYDFIRKRLSIVVEKTGTAAAPTSLMITKGALEPVLEICTSIRRGEAEIPLSDDLRATILKRYEDWSAQGYRVLGVAVKDMAPQARYGRGDEAVLAFAGFLLFFDPPKQGVKETLAHFQSLGVRVVVITGDNRGVAVHLAQEVGLRVDGVLTGAQLQNMGEEALWHAAERTSLFAQVDPNQKERIIRALQKTGHVVGYLGDGINDAPALHAADVGISVDQAVDVAKEAADLVLLEHDLDVLRQGIEQGRRTFANTLKYIFTTTSANFGNMLSMAGASLFLPFLPLLAKQILLNNFLSDIPGMTIATDRVDQEWVDQPHRWNLAFIRRFMISFGLISAVFDYLTFGVLLYWVRATPEVFRTAWFVESLLTELVIALVVRTRRPIYRSRPGQPLLVSTIAVTVLTLSLPLLPLGGLFGFVRLPLSTLGAVVGITAMYVVAVEAAKRWYPALTKPE
jgi:P-type Mg2+ transporter